MLGAWALQSYTWGMKCPVGLSRPALLDLTEVFDTGGHSFLFEILCYHLFSVSSVSSTGCLPELYSFSAQHTCPGYAIYACNLLVNFKVMIF